MSSIEYKHEDLISDRGKNRKLVHFWQDTPEGTKVHPNPIQLVGGLPNHQFFPIDTIDVNLKTKPFESAYDKDVELGNLDKPLKASELQDDFDDLNKSKTKNYKKNTFTTESVSSDTAKIDLKNSLQYSDVDGLSQLQVQITDFVKRVVKPINENWKAILTLGGADGVSKSFDILVNPGDAVLFEEFTFIPVLNGLRERGGIPIPIKLSKIFSNQTPIFDYYEELSNMLRNWTELYPGLPKPKALYTIPNGHNPLGLAQSFDHKKKIYELAETYNFMIIEDEPYSYLNFTKIDEEPNFKLTNDEFVKSLNKSYTTLDKSGRVIRVETFSKIYAPGLRLGFVVAHERIIQLIKGASAIYTRSPNGFSQAFLNNTIIQLGGVEGWIHWITLVRNEYLIRKNAMVSKLLESEAGKKNYLKVIDPNCGMFVSCIINFEANSKFDGQDYKKLMNELYIKCLGTGVLVVLGGNMSVDNSFSTERSNFIRMAISYADDVEILEEASERLSKAAIELFES